jgi:uncharacterized protein
MDGAGGTSRSGLITRRRLLAAGCAAAGACLADAWSIEPYRLAVSRHDVWVRGLHPGLEGIRIAQISDVHLPGTPAVAREAVEVIGRERPEVVLLTGDIAEHAATLPALGEFASAVRGTAGTYAVFGNWEHKAHISRAAAERVYSRAGVEFLMNEAAVLHRNGGRLGLLGFDDPVFGHPDLGRTLAARGPADVELWMVHAPAWVDTVGIIDAAPALVLTGHTHGGQIRLPGITLFTPPGSGRYVSGWYHNRLAPIYVSRGVGTASIRARFFCPPELPIFTLRRA